MSGRVLNLGCGAGKIEGAINVDFSEKVNPDLCFDVTKVFPLEDKSFDEVYFFHCIEHIEKWKHPFVFAEIHRILRLDGILYISYPEFRETAKLWLDQKLDRKFIEATIFGRQAYPGDYHFCAMDSLEVRQLLEDIGFKLISQFSEPTQKFNSVLVAERLPRTISYEEVLYNEVFKQ